MLVSKKETQSSVIPAAQYLRMSTEHQQYSLENQACAIGEYASNNGFSIVRTYQDAGRSGLRLRNRKGLADLLNDVIGGQQIYRAILVYDVSRWGRFQDIDESAHYEFICKNAGVPVHYCAEQFANDGTSSSAIIKALKRSMAGEYSRELSVKVCEGKKRLASYGFRQGGYAGYGLRRLLISSERKPKQKLNDGEYKSISTDRVLLIPGFKREVECVRQMYSAVLRGRRPAWILRDLISRHVPYKPGKSWNIYAVIQILTNPKYAGDNVWGRTASKLKTQQVSVPRDQWAVCSDAFQPIVDRSTFERVQTILKKRTINLDNDELLKRLKRLLANKGKLSEAIINKSRAVPVFTTYKRRFGSVQRAYELIGYVGSKPFYKRWELGVKSREVRDRLIEEMQKQFPEKLKVQRSSPYHRPVLHWDGTQFSILNCPSRRRPGGRPYWEMAAVAREQHLPTLLCLLDPETHDVFRMYLLPRVTNSAGEFYLDGRWIKRARQLDSISELGRELEKMPRQL